MGKGGGTQSTQTVQKADPWAGVQPALSQLYASALQNFNQGPNQYYPGSTVAPQSDITQLAQQGLYNRALSGNPLLSEAQQQAQRTLTDQYMLANPATAGLTQAANQNFLSTNPAGAGLTSLANRDFLGSNPGTVGLQQTASGGMLNANPYLDTMFNTAAGQVGRQFSNSVMPGVASMFSGAGRFGSNQMADVMGTAQQQYGNTLDKLASDIYGGNYAAERGLQQQAQGQLGQFGLAGQGLQQQAFGQLGTLGIAGQGLQQQALGELGTQYGRERALQTSALGMAPGLSQADYYDLGQLGNLGAQQEAYGQQLLNSDINRWDFSQNQPAQQLQLLNQLLQGSGQYAGQSSTTTAPGPYRSPLMGALGGAQMGGALGGLFGTGAGMAATTAAAGAGLAPAALGTMEAGSMFGPWGMGIGALLGLLGS